MADESDPTYWSDEMLTNGGAETGDTSGWTASSSSAVATGHAGSYCFSVEEGGSLSQALAPPAGTKKIAIGAYFLPELPVDPECDREQKAHLKCEVTYSDGTKSLSLCPCEVVEESGSTWE